MKAIKELGIKKSLKYVFSLVLKVIVANIYFSPLKILLLRLLGAKIGRNCIIHQVRFINLHRTGLKGLVIGNNCYLDDEVILDLADNITLEDHVTLSVASLILTHTNVGFKDHPLQKAMPSFCKSVLIKNGSFIGARAVLLPGIEIGSRAFIGANAVVSKNIPPNTLAAGLPAKTLRKFV